MMKVTMAARLKDLLKKSNDRLGKFLPIAGCPTTCHVELNMKCVMCSSELCGVEFASL